MAENLSSIPSVTIKKIRFNNQKELELSKDDIVIFVGANNVGKSRTLKDLKEELICSQKPKIMVSTVEFDTNNFTTESMKEYFEENYFKDSYGNYNVQIEGNHIKCYSEENFHNITNKNLFYNVLFTFLSTENRLNLTKPIVFNNIIDNSSFNIIKKLAENSKKINDLNKFLYSGFKKETEIYYGLNEVTSQMNYKIGNKEEVEFIINSSKREGNEKLRKLGDLHEQGDGIRSAVAILSSLVVNNHHLYLIDEPETFLHPPQARLLGQNIVELSKDKQCIISTHNIDLIRGVLETDSSRVKIIKIDRDEYMNYFNVLQNNNLVKIANDRNLKYSNILNGLFYDKVILCENESDCKFYSSVLESMNNTDIYQNTLFCAVGGKDQFKLIIPILNSLCIKYSIIADIDLINDKRKLEQLLNSIHPKNYEKISEAHEIFLNEFEKQTNSQVKTQNVIKQEIDQIFIDVRDDMFMSLETSKKIKSTLKNINSLNLLKDGGKSIIPSGDCMRRYTEIKQKLEENNIYILDCGEIEKFVPIISGHGNSWVESVLKEYENMDNQIFDNVKIFIKTVFNI